MAALKAVNPTQAASPSGPAALVNKPNIAIDNMKAMGQTLNEHASMYQIAADTGGHAYLNTHDLKSAVADPGKRIRLLHDRFRPRREEARRQAPYH